jgi:hypothetical protein
VIPRSWFVHGSFHHRHEPFVTRPDATAGSNEKGVQFCRLRASAWRRGVWISARRVKIYPACTSSSNCRRRDRLDLFGRNRMHFIHNFPATTIVANDHRLEVCGFAVPRPLRRRGFLAIENGVASSAVFVVAAHPFHHIAVGAFVAAERRKIEEAISPGQFLAGTRVGRVGVVDRSVGIFEEHAFAV